MSATAPRPHPAAWRSRADRRGRAAARTGRIAWALTHRRMAGMDAGPGSDLGGLGWFAATWALMMAAMMRPQSRRWWPRTVVGQRAWGPPRLRGRLSDRLARSGLAGLRARRRRPLARLGFLAWDEAGRYLAGSVILGGALYPLTGPEEACLRRC